MLHGGIFTLKEQIVKLFQPKAKNILVIHLKA